MASTGTRSMAVQMIHRQTRSRDWCRTSESVPDQGSATALPRARVLVGLNVEVQLELVGVWPQAHRIDFLATLILEPGLNHILREHIALGEKLVVVLQRVERPLE